MSLDPVAVALKFGFLVVLYLFLLWVARSALRDLRRTGGAGSEPDGPVHHDYGDATAMHQAGTALDPSPAGDAWSARLVVRSAPGLRGGEGFEVGDGLLLGRGTAADVPLQDSYSSSRHARLISQGDAVVLEDLGSTNGTYLNGDPLTGPQPLHDGDRIRIGDSEFSFQR